MNAVSRNVIFLPLYLAVSPPHPTALSLSLSVSLPIAFPVSLSVSFRVSLSLSLSLSLALYFSLSLSLSEGKFRPKRGGVNCKGRD